MANDTTTQKLPAAATASDFEQVQRLGQAGAGLNVLVRGDTLLERITFELAMEEPIPAFAAGMLRLLLQLGCRSQLPGRRTACPASTLMKRCTTDRTDGTAKGIATQSYQATAYQFTPRKTCICSSLCNHLLNSAPK